MVRGFHTSNPIGDNTMREKCLPRWVGYPDSYHMYHVVYIANNKEVDGRFAANEREIESAASELIRMNFPLADGDRIEIVKVKQ